MTATEISRLSYRNGTNVIVQLKGGLAVEGTWVGYLDRGGSTCGILVATEEGGIREIAEVLFTKIKSID